jgi:hypothetical protein
MTEPNPKGRPRGQNYDLNHSHPSTTTGDTGNDLQEARLLKIQAETRSLDLKNAILLREYIPIGEVTNVVATEYTRVRQKLLALESKLPHVLAPLNNPIDIKQIIKQEVDEILSELSSDEKYKDVSIVSTTSST